MVYGVDSDEPDTASLFTSAYRQHASAVLAYVRSQGVEDPEAVTQDTFVALFPRLTALTGGAAGMRTLIFSIAHARIADYHRHRSRVSAPLAYDPESDVRVSPSAEDHVIDGHVGVGALMSCLSLEHREVLALRVLADLSLDETARILNKTPGAIKQLQRRALLALKRELTMNVERAR